MLGKIDKHEYLIGEEILTPDQSRIIEGSKFTYSPLGKAFEKQIKTIEDEEKNPIKVTESPEKQIITYDKWLSNFKKCELSERRIKQWCSEIKESNNGADHSELVYEKQIW